MALALVLAQASPRGTMLDAAGGSYLAGGACMVSQATWECGASNRLRQHCTVLAARQANHPQAA